MKFTEHKGLNLVKVNEEVLADWEKNDVFHKSIDEREGAPKFIFFEGPPSANGHPGIHHVMGRTIKDTILRYKTMKGFQVNRKAGWDTHGLPVELSVEKSLGITKEDIGKKISVDDYNRACRENVMMYTNEWTELTNKMGYWVDLEHPYITYDIKYIETLWYLLKKLYEKGLLYKGYTIQPYSPAAGTGLSSHELNQPGCYRDVKDTTVTAQFSVTERSAALKDLDTSLPLYILAWTTTPWTLPSNTALCVGPKIDYVAVKGQNPYNGKEGVFVVAEARLSAYFQAEEGKELEILWRGKGTDLVGTRYEQLFPWVKPCDLEGDKIVNKEAEAFRVIPGDYVTTEDGTGVVHIAPTFGADDAKVAKDAGIPSLFVIDKAGDTRPMVDFQGKYFVKADMNPEFEQLCVNEGYWKHSGDYVKNAYDPKYNVDGKYDEKAASKDMDLNVVICLEMKEEGTAFKIEKHVHNYPHCWRTDKPVLYYPLDSWFIRSTAKKDRMVELNKTIQWKPESTGTGRFGNWLENLNDWNLSRSRFWGTPLPIWRDEDGEEKCIGSLQELYDEIEKAVSTGIMSHNPLKEKGFVPGNYSQENYDLIDLHRPFVDDIYLVSSKGKQMKRESDLIDVWFDSGSMPYAQIHYPFENKELIDDKIAFPADFINEGVDQTRGWFFTLHAIATMVFDSVAFKSVISTGLVLDAKGNKMSKHVGNVVNPFEMMDKYGADAVRFYMLTNSEPWDNLKFDPEGVDEVKRKFFGTLFNTYSFFSLYANVDGFDYREADVPLSERPEIDRWILSVLHTLIIKVKKEMQDYDPTRAGRLIEQFVNDDLSNWYVRLNRKRFWGKEMSTDKLSAFQTLYTCLETVAKLLAPFAPFYADRLYLDLQAASHRESHVSVHLADYPKADTTFIDEELETKMCTAQKITSMVLALRRKVNIKVRQPLHEILIPAVDSKQRYYVSAVKDLILNEVNVKELKFVEGSGILVKRVKCNFRTMGKKYGKLMKSVAQQLNDLSQEDINLFEANKTMQLSVEGSNISVDIEDVEIINEDIPGWLVSNEGNLTVALDVTISDELRNEGIAREIINRIQNIRKDSGLEITDRIQVVISDTEVLKNAVIAYEEYIKSQILADSITFAANEGQSVEIDELTINILISKV